MHSAAYKLCIALLKSGVQKYHSTMLCLRPLNISWYYVKTIGRLPAAVHIHLSQLCPESQVPLRGRTSPPLRR